MNTSEHDRSGLAAYALGRLDPAEQHAMHAHVAGCADCQREIQELGAVRLALDSVPPEAFLDGPPPDGDLLLQKTLRRARSGLPPVRRRSPVPVVAAAVAVAFALAGGIVIGRQTAGDQIAGPGPSTSVPAEAQTKQVTDPDTGAVMAVTLIPKPGWVWVSAQIDGIPAGLECELRVVPSDGEPVLAGGWLASKKGELEGTQLEGTALVDPADVASVDVVTTDGKTMVSVPL